MTIAVRTSLPIVGAVSQPVTLLTVRTIVNGVAVLMSVIVSGFILLALESSYVGESGEPGATGFIPPLKTHAD